MINHVIKEAGWSTNVIIRSPSDLHDFFFSAISYKLLFSKEKKSYILPLKFGCFPTCFYRESSSSKGGQQCLKMANTTEPSEIAVFLVMSVHVYLYMYMCIRKIDDGFPSLVSLCGDM